MNDIKRALDLVNLVKAEKSAANSAVQADNLIIDDGRERQPVEELIDLVEHRVGLGRLLTKATAAFLSKPKCIVNPLVFMITSEQVNFIREFHF